MEPREVQYTDDEVTIDLAHFVVSILKKWKSLVILVLIGALLGAIPQWLPKTEEPERSREDAALVEQMKVAANARSQYEELNRYVKYSPFMRLDSQNVYTARGEYYIPQCDDPDQLSAAFNALFADEAVRQKMCSILGIFNETDLNKMFWAYPSTITDNVIVGEMQVTVKEKMGLHVGLYAATKEQAQQALDFLCETVETLPKATPGQHYELTQTSKTIQSGIASGLRSSQNEIRDELSAAHKNYTDLEKAFDEEQYDMYQEYILTGKSDELPVELFPSNPLKKPVIIAFVFGFLGCGWYAVAYLLSGKVKTSDEAASITGKNVLAFIDESAPRKNPIDRWLESLEMHSYPAPVSAAYAAAAVAKLGSTVVLRDEENAELKVAAQSLGTSMGLIAQDPQTLNSLNADTQAVLLVKLGTTTKMQLQRECALCRQYGIKVAGTVLVK